jgi:hypothetical protein
MCTNAGVAAAAAAASLYGGRLSAAERLLLTQ